MLLSLNQHGYRIFILAQPLSKWSLMVLLVILKFLAQTKKKKEKMGKNVVSSVLSPEWEAKTKRKLQEQRVARSLKGKVQIHIPFSIPSCIVAPQKCEETDQLYSLKWSLILGNFPQPPDRLRCVTAVSCSSKKTRNSHPHFLDCCWLSSNYQNHGTGRASSNSWPPSK